MSGGSGARYRFGPRERGGALAGWRAGQIVTVAVGLLFGVLVLRWEPNAAGVAAAIGILVLYGALATVPVAGRTGDEWLPVTVCWGTRRAGAATAGRAWPRCAGCAYCGAGWHDMGVVHDRAPARSPAALSLRGGSFALLGADEQDRRVGAWASVLSSLAREGSPVRRVQWIAASFPDDGRGVRSYLAAEANPAAASACTALVRGAADRHGLAHLRPRRRPRRPGATDQVGRGRLRRPGPRGRVARAPARGRRRCEVDSVLTADDLAQQLLRTYEPHVRAAGRPLAWGTRGRWRWRRAGRPSASTACSTPRSGWRSGRGRRSAATSWLHSSWARPARPSRW